MTAAKLCDFVLAWGNEFIAGCSVVAMYKNLQDYVWFGAKTLFLDPDVMSSRNL